jgi:hypothetical protein
MVAQATDAREDVEACGQESDAYGDPTSLSGHLSCDSYLDTPSLDEMLIRSFSLPQDGASHSETIRTNQSWADISLSSEIVRLAIFRDNERNPPSCAVSASCDFPES